MEVAKQVLTIKESGFISADYGSIMSKIVRGRRNRSFSLFDVNNLFSVVKNILLRDNTSAKPVNVDSTTAEVIRKLSCKLACNCSIKNVQGIVEEILGNNNYLSKYDWEAMMVTALAAFATNYGEFHIFVESCANNNQVFQNISLLKQLPEIEFTRKLVGEIDKVLVVAMEMIESSLKLMELRRANIAQISTTLGSSVDYVAQAACYAIHTVVICASLITAPADGFVVHKVESMLLHLTNDVIRTTIQALRAEIEATSLQVDEWQILVDVFFNTDMPNIAAILKALIKPDANGKSALVIGNNSKNEVSFEQIKGENIYLLISGGYISEKEIMGIVELMKKETKYQLVWIPISMEFKRFTKIQCLMNWYTVQHPSHIKPVAIKFIKETWMFQGHTILVPMGKKEPEFYPIDWLWTRGSFPGAASPPTPLPQLSLSYLLSDIYYLKNMSKTSSPSIICLFGGEDLVWIKSFSKLLDEVSKFFNSKFQINMEFIYVSKSEGIDTENAEIFDYINTKNFGCSWKADGAECWRFWVRVESFFRQQIRIETDIKNDVIKEALTLLSYNANHKGWVVFGQYGTNFKLAQATGNVAEIVLKQISKLYMYQGTNTAFIEALRVEFNAQAKKLSHHCSHIILPASVGDLGDCIVCPICDKTMTKYSFYRCCV